MSKSIELPELNYAWHEQRLLIKRRTYSAAGRLNGSRWQEICNAHKRRVNRRRGVRNRAAKVAAKLTELQFWADAIRANRKLSALQPQVFRFGNSGRAIE